MARMSRLVCLATASLYLSACGGARLIKDPEPFVLEQPLALTSDQNLEVAFDWVIVRAGPGSWAKNADWDEYLLRVRNLSGTEMRVTGIAVYDALDVRMQSGEIRKDLVKESRAVKKRFKGEDIEVKAGMGGAALAATGGAAYVAGASVGLAALGGSSTAATFAGAAVVGILAAPVLVVGGTLRAVNTSRVGKEMLSRSTTPPILLQAGEVKSLDIFFPIAPSPKQVELSYSHAAGEMSIIIDTSETLKGLHLDNEKK